MASYSFFKLNMLCRSPAKPAHKSLFLLLTQFISSLASRGEMVQPRPLPLSFLLHSQICFPLSSTHMPSARLTLAPAGSLFWLESCFFLTRLWRSASSREADAMEIHLYCSSHRLVYRDLFSLSKCDAFAAFFRDQISHIRSDILSKHILMLMLI